MFSWKRGKGTQKCVQKLLGLSEKKFASQDGLFLDLRGILAAGSIQTDLKRILGMKSFTGDKLSHPTFSLGSNALFYYIEHSLPSNSSL